MPNDMSRRFLRPLSAAFLLLGGTCAVFALDVTQTQPTPAGNGSPTTGTTATGGATTTAATADTGGGIGQTLSDLKKYFTITADLREEYDDNVFTTKDNKVSSFKEDISPSILFSYPMDNSTFDMRYTFGLTYYNSRPGSSYDQDHDFVVRYNHAFSDRFNLDVRDDAGYHEDPSLLNSIGTVAREGGYYENVATAEFTAQWTPLFGTVTSYSNSFITYENQAVGDEQDSDENTVSQDFRFAFWPTVTFAVGAIYDNITYDDADRGYSNYTGNTGFDWQALPSLSVGFRVGGSITALNQGSTSESPYASANVNWQIGEKSRFIASYVHSVTPTDVVFAQGQESDRFTANFLYNITERITTHLEGVYTYSDYTTTLLSPNSGAGNFTEDVVGLDTGVTYHYNQYVDFEGGYILSNVSSGENDRDYTRNQFYVGIRGTY